jgi:hypothetical protein
VSDGSPAWGQATESHNKAMHFVGRITAIAPEPALDAKCAVCTLQGTAVRMSIKTSNSVLARVPLWLARGNILQPTAKGRIVSQHQVVQYELIEEGTGGKHLRWMKTRSKRTRKTENAFAYPSTIPNEVKNNPKSRHAKTTGLL